MYSWRPCPLWFLTTLSSIQQLNYGLLKTGLQITSKAYSESLLVNHLSNNTADCWSWCCFCPHLMNGVWEPDRLWPWLQASLFLSDNFQTQRIQFDRLYNIASHWPGFYFFSLFYLFSRAFLFPVWFSNQNYLSYLQATVLDMGTHRIHPRLTALNSGVGFWVAHFSFQIVMHSALWALGTLDDLIYYHLQVHSWQLSTFSPGVSHSFCLFSSLLQSTTRIIYRKVTEPLSFKRKIFQDMRFL